VASDAIVGGAPFRFAGDKPPRVVFLVGDNEYKTAETVPRWARAELEPRGVRCEFLLDDPAKPLDFPLLAKLDADALFVSLRRRGVPAAQLAGIRAFVESGRPVLGIRTASHAFDPKNPAAGEGTWPAFDREVFGGWYQNHYGAGPTTVARIAGAHPALAGMAAVDVKFSSHLYKSRELAATTTVLMNGTLEGQPDVREPVAWVNAKPRAFYTSLGAPEDFEKPEFRRLLLNATLWMLGQPVPQE
jgi:type 1 glutamine amidotransferase